MDIQKNERVGYNWHFGYAKIENYGTKYKRYHAILWDKGKLVIDETEHSTATEAANHGHMTRHVLEEARRQVDIDGSNNKPNPKP